MLGGAAKGSYERLTGNEDKVISLSLAEDSNSLCSKIVAV